MDKAPIERGEWKLVDEKTNERVCVGDVRKDFRGDSSEITGGRPPHKPSSSGFIYTKGGREFYAGVFGTKWVKE